MVERSRERLPTLLNNLPILISAHPKTLALSS